MGWCGGARIAEDIWSLIRPHIPFEKRQSIAGKIVGIFEGEDADTMYEAEQLIKDASQIEDEKLIEDEFYDRY